MISQLSFSDLTIITQFQRTIGQRLDCHLGLSPSPRRCRNAPGYPATLYGQLLECTLWSGPAPHIDLLKGATTPYPGRSSTICCADFRAHQSELCSWSEKLLVPGRSFLPVRSTGLDEQKEIELFSFEPPVAPGPRNSLLGAWPSGELQLLESTICR